MMEHKEYLHLRMENLQYQNQNHRVYIYQNQNHRVCHNFWKKQNHLKYEIVKCKYYQCLPDHPNI